MEGKATIFGMGFIPHGTATFDLARGKSYSVEVTSFHGLSRPRQYPGLSEELKPVSFTTSIQMTPAGRRWIKSMLAELGEPYRQRKLRMLAKGRKRRKGVHRGAR